MENLVGAWRLRRFEATTADEEPTYPLGENATGYLIYTADGHMSATLMRAERMPFGSDDIRAGTAEERVRAYEDFIAYAGRYEVREGAVVHHVELALFPNWIGSEQLRYVELDGDTLTITTPPVGRYAKSRLIWERARRAVPAAGMP